jgi:tocopherol O-methyltransferase
MACRKFVGELCRVLTPGGKVVIVTWCHRNLLPGETALKPAEELLLQRINEAYYLPPWCSQNVYEDIFGAVAILVLVQRNVSPPMSAWPQARARIDLVLPEQCLRLDMLPCEAFL